MDDEQLDLLLRRLDPARETPFALQDVVARARVEARARRVSGRARRGIVAAGLGIGVLGSLAAGISYQDYLLTVPPYAGLNPGDQRGSSAMEIIAQYGPDAGETCLLVPDFRNLTAAQLDAVDAHIEGRPDWHAWSEQTGEDARNKVATGDYQHHPDGDPLADAWHEALTAALESEMKGVVPELQYMGADAGMPMLTAWGYSCR
jgi:hypothetical protein